MDIVYKNGRDDVCLSFESLVNIEKIYRCISNLEGIPQSDFFLTFNGKYLQSECSISSPCTVRFHLRVPGGKGGFGSMLRAIGARIEKTTNHEACRDLSGRRMRDVNHEKAIGEWLKQKESEDANREERHKKKLEKILNPKDHYEDKTYTSNLQSNAEKIDEALRTALQKRDEKLGSKRKIQNDDVDHGKQKKYQMWIGVNDSESDESEDESEKIVSVGEDEPCCSRDFIGDFDDTHINNENHNSKLAGLSKNDNNNIDNVRVSDTELYGESNMPNNSNEECRDSILPIPVKSMIEPKEASNSKPASVQNNVEDNLTTVSKTDVVNDSIAVKDVVDTTKDGPMDLSDFESPKQLESIGLERLKAALMSIGLKCGGTLQERAQRLFLTKDTPLEKLDHSLFAKPAKTKHKK